MQNFESQDVLQVLTGRGSTRRDFRAIPFPNLGKPEVEPTSLKINQQNRKPEMPFANWNENSLAPVSAKLSMESLTKSGRMTMALRKKRKAAKDAPNFSMLAANVASLSVLSRRIQPNIIHCLIREGVEQQAAINFSSRVADLLNVVLLSAIPISWSSLDRLQSTLSQPDKSQPNPIRTQVIEAIVPDVIASVMTFHFDQVGLPCSKNTREIQEVRLYQLLSFVRFVNGFIDESIDLGAQATNAESVAKALLDWSTIIRAKTSYMS